MYRFQEYKKCENGSKNLKMLQVHATYEKLYVLSLLNMFKCLHTHCVDTTKVNYLQ